jgi:hypothetical protein
LKALFLTSLVILVQLVTTVSNGKDVAKTNKKTSVSLPVPAVKDQTATLEEEKLWGLLDDAYRRNGLKEESSKKTIAGLRANMAKMSSEERVFAVQTMLKNASH